MALTTKAATLGGASVSLIVGADGSGNIGAGHVTLDSSGAEKGVAANPLVTSVGSLPGSTYKTVAASQTAQVLGATGATGDLLNGLLVVPANTSPGAVTILDNATSIVVFAGGTSSVSTLIPFFIPLGAKSVSGAWKVTTGASVSVVAVGSFT